MTQHPWSRLRRILEHADQLGDAEARAFVVREIRTDDNLRLELELLAVLLAPNGANADLGDLSHKGIDPTDPKLSPSTAHAEFKPGERWGPLLIHERIGGGAFGNVYRAWDENLDREVALKILSAGGRGTVSGGRAFDATVREGQLLARVRHPNVVSVYGAQVIGGQVGLWMELIRGATLERLVREQGPFSSTEATVIGHELCRALSVVHRAGLLHRDIKASNVMRETGGRIVLMDFGTGTDLRSAPVLAGTPVYMAPEALMGEGASIRSDIYSLGVVLFFMVSGAFPIEGQTLDELVTAVQSGRQVSLPDLRPDLPASFVRMVHRAIAIDPNKRYRSAGEMQEHLADLLADGRDIVSSPRAEPIGFVSQLKALIWRRPKAIDIPLAAPSPQRSKPLERVSAPAAGFDDARQKDSDETLQPERPRETTSDRVPGHGADKTMLMSSLSSLSSLSAGDVVLRVIKSIDSALEGHTFPIATASFYIGRQSSDVSVNDPQLSRQHAVIEFSEGRHTIRDLESANGTYLNGRRLPQGMRQELLLGGKIEVGTTVFMVRPARQTPLPNVTGTCVADRYTLKRLLRESEKGALYEARDLHTERRVAVKLLAPLFARQPGYLDRFNRQARMTASLQHPHVCHVLDFGQTPVQTEGNRQEMVPYLCFALMDGGNLADRLESQPPLSLIANWIGQAACGLQYIHDQGLVHGDVKPTAICFDGNDHLYVTDFSLAQPHGVDDTNTIVGVPAFMAPEQWRPGVWTAATDQFALAAVAYTLLAGMRPFEGQDDPVIRERNFKRGALPVHEEARERSRRDVPRGVSGVLRQGLATEVRARFPSISAFAKAFETALTQDLEWDVFISYRRQPSALLASVLFKELSERQHLRTFVDVQRQEGGVPFPAKISRAIESCGVFVCLLAPGTLDSDVVREEIRLAHQYRRSMIPVIQEGFEKPVQTSEDVRALLAFEGIEITETFSGFLDYTLATVSRLVKEALKR